MQQENDIQWMKQALSLAEQGQFSTYPNPKVGCIIVKNNHLIGAGFHRFAGESHAEIHALNMAGKNAEGATAYITLEPCAHHGRTPPCTDALIHAKIKRAVIACLDPNPLVSGKGIANLQKAGIQTTLGILEKEAKALNRAFFYRIQNKRPWITLKIASSLDGRTALANGESQWITNQSAREDVHRHRLQADALLIGSQSAIIDQARLSARYKTPLAKRPPLRILLDGEGKVPTNSAIFQEKSPLLLITHSALTQHYPKHVEHLQLKKEKNGKISLNALIDTLGAREITHLFIEAGATLAGAFIEQKLANEILLYLAPCFLGNDARPLLNLPPIQHLSDRIDHQITDCAIFDGNLRLTLSPIN